MAESRPNFGSDVQGAQETLDYLKQLEQQTQQLQVREQELRSSELASSNAITENTNALARAIEETRLLAAATGELSSQLRQETELLASNSAAWASRTAAMRTAARTTTLPSAAGTVATGDVAAAAAAEGEAQVRQVAQRAARAASVAVGEQGVLFGESRYRRAGVRPANSLIYEEQAAEREVNPNQLPMFGPGWRASRSRPSIAPEPATETAIPPTQGAAAAFRAQAESEAAAATEAERLITLETEQAQRAAALAAEQLRVNQAYQASVSVYAESSSALSRNGALTTEFIQAFARGDVTLKEFESQMLSTIGKFGGWALAGGAVYGVYDAIKKLGQGATQTQEGVQQLSRFIPTAGTTQRGQTEQTFRDISLELNVPINEVTSAMGVMARTFHDVSDAGQAARAVLLATRLDQIAPTQSEQYFTGIAQSFGFAGQRGGGSELIGVINSLNSLQNIWAARVSQTLPGLARAAPAAEAAGLTGPTGRALLEALVGVGVRAGISGPQVGTALVRAMNGTQTFTANNLENLRALGLNPVRGQFGQLIDQIVRRQTGPRDQQFSENQLRAIAQDVGGTMLGPRVLLPILQHANLIPGMTDTALHPPQTASEELSHILGGVGQEFTHIGVVLENLGSELESAGLVSALQVGLKGIDLFGNALIFASKPVDQIAQIFGQLPGPLKDAFGIGVGALAFRAVGRSDFGFATQQFIGRLPALGALGPRDQELALQTLGGQRETFLLPELGRRSEQANLRNVTAQAGLVSATSADASAQAVLEANKNDETAIKAAAEAAARLAAATAAAESAQAKATEASEAYDKQLVLIQTITDRSIDLTTRVSVAQANGLSIELETVKTRAQILEQLKKQLLATASTTTAGTVASAGVAYGGTGVGAEDQALLAAAGQRRASTALQEAPVSAQAAALVEGAAIENPAILQEVATENIPATETAASAGLAATLGSRATSVVTNPLGLVLAGGLVGGGLSSLGASGPGNFITTASLLGAGGLYAGRAIAGSGAFASLAGRLGTSAEALGGEAGIGTVGGVAGLGLAGVAYGALNHGTGGLIAGIGGGAATGAAIGLAGGPFDEITVPVGAVVGGAVGGVAHFIGSIFGGGGQSPTQRRREATQRGAQELAKLVTASSGGVANNAPGIALADFATVFNKELGTAFNNGVNQQDAQVAQKAVEKAVQNNMQLLKAAGVGTPLGSYAETILNAATKAVLTSSTTRQDPYDTGQVIDNATQGLLSGISSRFTYRTTVSRGAGQGALSTAISETEQTYKASVGSTIKQLSDEAASLEATQRALKGSGGDQLNAQIEAVKAKLAQATALGAQIKIQDIEQIASEVQTVIGNVVTQAGDVASLASAEGGNNPFLQARAQISQGTSELTQITAEQNKLRATGHPLLANSLYFREQREQASTIAAQGRTAITQASGSLLQSREQVAASSVPSDDTVQQAQVALTNAAQYYQFVAANLNAMGGPAALNQALANVRQAQQQLRIAANAQAQIPYQIQEENQAGDPVAAAITQIAAAQHALAVAIGPGEILSAKAQLAQANQALHQAMTQHITDIGDLKASTTNQTLQQDVDKLVAAEKAVTNAKANNYGAETIKQLEASRNQAYLQYFNDTINQELATISYQQSTLQISAQGALAKLEAMYKQKNLSVSERQQISSEIYSIETNQDNTSLFDLAPGGGNIKTPTIFDINAALSRTRRGRGDLGGPSGRVDIGGAQVSTTAGSLNVTDTAVVNELKALHATIQKTVTGGGDHITYHIEVKDAKTAQQIGAILDRANKSNLRSRMKAAGHR